MTILFKSPITILIMFKCSSFYMKEQGEKNSVFCHWYIEIMCFKCDLYRLVF